MLTSLQNAGTDLRPKATWAQAVGRAGDPLPSFTNHMIRQRVTRHGDILPLPEPENLPGCALDRNLVGVIKQGPVKKWLEQKRRWDSKFKATKARIHEKRVRDAKVGFASFGEGEMPPPSALAGRRKIGGDLMKEKKKTKSYGMSLWSLWGSKHDEMTVERERVADQKEKPEVVVAADGEKGKEKEDADGEKMEAEVVVSAKSDRTGRRGNNGKVGELSRSRSRRRTVTDQNQTGTGNDSESAAGGVPPMPTTTDTKADGKLLSPDYVPDTGVTGKRPKVDGIAVPFSLRKEADTASMITLNSKQTVTPRPMSPATIDSKELEHGPEAPAEAGPGAAAEEAASDGRLTPGFVTPALERPGLDTFVTAAEDLPKVAGASTKE